MWSPRDYGLILVNVRLELNEIFDRLCLRMIVTMKGMFLSGGEKDEHEMRKKKHFWSEVKGLH